MSTTVNSEQLRELGMDELGEIEPDSLVDLILVRKDSPGGQMSGIYEVMENDGPSVSFSTLLQNSETMPKVFTFINKDDCQDSTNCIFPLDNRIVEEPTSMETATLFYSVLGVFCAFVVVMIFVYLCFFCKAKPDYTSLHLPPPKDWNNQGREKRDNSVAIEVDDGDDLGVVTVPMLH